MLKSNYLKLLAITSGLTLAAAAGAQVLLGGFQGPTDPTDAGWYNYTDSDPITSDVDSSFVQANVTNYPYSLQLTNASAGFGIPSLELKLTSAQIQQLLQNSWLTFTFSVTPNAATTGGYNQIYNLQFQFWGAGGSSSYGSTNWCAGGNAAATWGVYSEAEGISGEGAGNDSSGEPNYGLYSGYGLQSQTVTVNYSGLTNAIASGLQSAGYLNIIFQGNTGGGSPALQDFNNVVLSTGPFGQSAAAPTEPVGAFIVDDFAANGVGPQNPTNDDYFPTAYNYANGQITNVWVDFYGLQATNSWAAGIYPTNAPTGGSLEIQWVWNGSLAPSSYANQWAEWENGSVYGLPAGVGEPYYTNFQCDIMFAPGSAVGADGTFGGVQFGTYAPNNNGNAASDGNPNQDWFGGPNNNVTVQGTNGGVWQHVSIALSSSDPAEQAIASVAIHMLANFTDATINGPSTLYVDNIEFTGPGTVVTIPAPKLQIQKAIPALRIFAGSTADTYGRESLVTEDSSQSWIGGQYPVSYSFSLLDNIPVNIGQTMLELIPTATETPGQTTYNNEYVDYQSSNGLWLVLAPYNATEVTATVEWKTNLPNANPNHTVLTLTNSTIGTWKLTFTGTQAGSLTPPGGSPVNFTIADNNASSDFANPVVANFGLQPNSIAGEGEYEDWGSISVSGVQGVKENENFTTETQEWTGASGETPDAEFTASDSEQASSLVFVLPNYDRYWIGWTLPASGYTLVCSTNITVAVTNWISPTYYGNYYDGTTPPRAVPSAEGASDWQLLPSYDLPTVDGNYQLNAPAINDTNAPDAYFILSTNTPNAFPVTP